MIEVKIGINSGFILTGSFLWGSINILNQNYTKY